MYLIFERKVKFRMEWKNGITKYPLSSGKFSRSWSKSRRAYAVSATLSVLKLSGATLDLLGRNIAPLHFKTERVAETAYARRDFEQLRLNFPELGGYFPFPGTRN